MNHATMLIILLLFSGASLLSAQDAAAPTLSSGIFSKEQVDRGKKLYISRCSNCHGEELEGGEAAALTRVQFRVRWQGKTVGERFDLIRQSMPLANPQSLDDQEHLDIVTYILNFNGYPAGDTELKPDLEMLNKITIEPPPAR